MDYEKAYKNLVAKVKNAYLFAQTDSTKNVLEDILSELRESEDDIHRKWILEYLYDGLRKSDEQFKEQFKAAIAYLEKQKERKPVKPDSYKNCNSRWKPSEEQMAALHTAAYLEEMQFYGGLKDKLRDLYEQLKKL